MSDNRPSPLPVCEHGRAVVDLCHKCHQRDIEIRATVSPLADEFWERQGQIDLKHLLYRAYRMGMARTKPEELK